jgi:hypothetical protein
VGTDRGNFPVKETASRAGKKTAQKSPSQFKQLINNILKLFKPQKTH